MICSNNMLRWGFGLRFLMAAVACIVFAGTEARAVDIYVLSNNGFGSSAANTDFGKIDSVTGAYTSITSLSGEVWNLAWNPTAANFFVTAGNAISTTLRTLTTSGTISSSMGTIGKTVYAMAYRTADGKLYAYDFADKTGTINTANGTWSLLNSTPGVSVTIPTGGRYSIMNDTMYFAGNFASPDGIGTMGYTATSTYQEIAANNVYANMVLANDGTTMYGIFGNGSAGNQMLYSIDTATGALTAGPTISGAGLGTYFHGAGIVPVPEPSTYALAAIATGVMAAIARRRKAARA